MPSTLAILIWDGAWRIITTVADDKPELESKFLKSGRNRRTENSGLAVLLRDPRFQVVDRSLKPILLEALGAPGSPIQAFDAVMTESPTEPITALNLRSHLHQLRLVEMKTTQKSIKDDRLEGFFFGVTESELSWPTSSAIDTYSRLWSSTRITSTAPNSSTSSGLNARIRSKRTQFQVTLARGISEIEAPYGTGPGPLCSGSHRFSKRSRKVSWPTPRRRRPARPRRSIARGRGPRS